MPLRNGVHSPTKVPARLPPIKAPIGQAPMPNLRNVTSKIGSLDNIKYKPAGGEKKQVVTKKLEWTAESKVRSLDNATYKPGGGGKKITTQKIEWNVKPKVGAKNLTYTPGGGHVKIESRKLEWKSNAASKISSTENVNYKPEGDQEKMKTEKQHLVEQEPCPIISFPASENDTEETSPVQPSSPQSDDQPALHPVDEPTAEEPIIEIEKPENESLTDQPETGKQKSQYPNQKQE
ncbi:uncharacterized protein LOC143255193 [Tachypleus tridentatus]|uniref:uncharacterized protein LOC143255193 n=1 Tax=Tachypleus tridentatus TaxID=6853 RepID=UPI003FD4C321